MSVINEINQLADIIKKGIKNHAEICVRHYKFVGKVEKEEAKTHYLTNLKNSNPTYKELKKNVEGIIRDCVSKYKMDKWMAESLLGIRLEKDFADAFERAWKEVVNDIQTQKP